MRRLGKGVLAATGVLAALWLGGRVLLEVQFPERAPGEVLFPDPMAELPLATAFAQLPADSKVQSRLRLLEGNAEAWAERWRLLQQAEYRLDISYFILKQDVFGVAFLGHLIQRARDGVRVRVLLDAMGTAMSRDLLGNDYLDTLVATPNVAVRMYRPLRYRYLDAFLTLTPAAILASDHDKILLADGRFAVIGGRNISAEYFTPLADSPTAFHDLDVLFGAEHVGSTVVTAFDAQYLGGEAHPVALESVDLHDSTEDLLLAYRAMDAWLAGTPIRTELAAQIRARGLPWLEQLQAVPHLRGVLHAPRPPMFQAEVRLLDSRTRLRRVDDPVTRSLIRLVRSARKSLLIQSPYLVLPEAAVDVLAEAAARGVAISVLTNSPLSSDNAWSQAFFLRQWPELLARVPGLRLFVVGGRHNLHGKMAVIDGRLSLIGTYNLDPLSMALNGELLAAIWSPPFAARVSEKPQAMIRAGAPVVFQYRIARGATGHPLRDRSGRPVVVFGPDDHLHPDQWRRVRRYRNLLAGVEVLPGLPLF